jgi:hypothetical protein
MSEREGQPRNNRAGQSDLPGSKKLRGKMVRDPNSMSRWRSRLAFGHHEDRTPIHGYAATREAAMAAFAKSWRRE